MSKGPSLVPPRARSGRGTDRPSRAVEGLSHVDAGGRARMVDISDKPDSDRRATAEGALFCATETLTLVREGKTPKGAVISTAELAGVMGAKRTAELIPLCHPLPLSKIAVSIVEDARLPGFRVSAEAKTRGSTGVEMEALTGAAVGLLTVYDMVKAVDRGMTLEAVRLEEKSGGRSGVFRRSRS